MKQSNPKKRRPDENQRIISIDNAVKENPELGKLRRREEKKEQEPEEEMQSDPPEKITEDGELDLTEISNIVEALLLTAESPISAERISDIVDLGGPKKVEDVIDKLQKKYEREGRPSLIKKIAGGFQIHTRPEFEPWVGKLHKKQHQDTLSQAAIETLSIVAYRQPLTRAEIEDIRGVQSGYILRSLIEKSLVRVTGRSEELGRPLLYGTTSDFLKLFGLSSLKELPALDNPDSADR